MDLGTIMDGIIAYDSTFKQFGYVAHGDGTPAWSHRVIHADGSVIDFRATEWTYTGPRGDHTGKDATELKEFLLDNLSREELIKLLLTA